MRVTDRLRAAWSWRWRRARQSLPHATVVYARYRALLGRHRLPPGNEETVTPADPTDRARLLRRSHVYGPIFRATFLRQFSVCVTDLAMARRLLSAHGDDLQSMSIDISAVVPEGFMRAMKGELHRRYRKALVRAVVSGDLLRAIPLLDAVIATRLREYADSASDHQNRAAAFHAMCGDIAERLLLVLFCDAPPGTETSAQLSSLLAGLSEPHRLWDVDSSQAARARAVMRALSTVADSLVATGGTPPVILARLRAAEALDDIMLANVTYMLRVGSSDLTTFFEWIVRWAVTDAARWEALVHEASDPARWTQSGSPEQRFPLAWALTLEVLRHTQSDRLMRRVVRDFVFEGFLIPKGSVLRVGTWEAHHDASAFEAPLEFRPQRFLEQAPDAATFSPFGIDQHVCPFSSASVQLGTLFAAVLARTMRVTLLHDGPGVIGVHHWEPPKGFSAALTPREG